MAAVRTTLEEAPLGSFAAKDRARLEGAYERTTRALRRTDTS
jgi:hypothetical protein